MIQYCTLYAAAVTGKSDDSRNEDSDDSRNEDSDDSRNEDNDESRNENSDDSRNEDSDDFRNEGSDPPTTAKTQKGNLPLSRVHNYNESIECSNHA